jgi:hypothetical protein
MKMDMDFEFYDGGPGGTRYSQSRTFDVIGAVYGLSLSFNRLYIQFEGAQHRMPKAFRDGKSTVNTLGFAMAFYLGK